MRPMFSYLGAKYRLAKEYGPPKHDLVVEPFAGSAAYSLYWEPKKVLLCDSNPTIVAIWRYLISVEETAILALPDQFRHVDELRIPDAAKFLIGFWLGKGKASPGKSRSAWGRQYANSGDCKVWGPEVRKRIASQLPKIRSWEIIYSDYAGLPNSAAHWFIDPPYQERGWQYPFSKIDYAHLSQWCASRKGFVQVCENEGATWMPFKFFREARAQTVNSKAKVSREVLFEATQ